MTKIFILCGSFGLFGCNDTTISFSNGVSPIKAVEDAESDSDPELNKTKFVLNGSMMGTDSSTDSVMKPFQSMETDLSNSEYALSVEISFSMESSSLNGSL
ncbi:hypothetical protein F0231_17090 [Vibrio sp. RE86]|uniref:hypothetical protein n=1 Tax=Vibrio sp. RE86 TaxID=2607605 RepID=UPI001493773E|nr:hypothetical protein [Vibrio sp. RE86]NOH81463.1 hypothetical protein [Vibrio sp. RE86]